jgi:hypothetical protein
VVVVVVIVVVIVVVVIIIVIVVVVSLMLPILHSMQTLIGPLPQLLTPAPVTENDGRHYPIRNKIGSRQPYPLFIIIAAAISLISSPNSVFN